MTQDATKPRTAAGKREYARVYQAQRRATLVERGLTATGTIRRKRQPGQGWATILEQAAVIVRSYGSNVTLRQLFYRLISAGTLRNTKIEYNQLSSRTAEARRWGQFPPLLDRTSEVILVDSWDSPEELLDSARASYRRDRTEGQEHQLWVIVEKAGLLAQFQTWFGDLGIPMVALSGYASQTDATTIKTMVRRDTRPAVLFYGGDFDPSGEDIYRDFLNRTGCWKEARRIVLTPEQVESYGLPEYPGKAEDPRAGRFMAAHGRLVQVEMDALDPNTLHDLFEEAIYTFWDQSAYDDIIEIEDAERETIRWGKVDE